MSEKNIRKKIDDNGAENYFLVACSKDELGKGEEEVLGVVQLVRESTEPCLTLPKPIELQKLYVHSSQHGTGLAKELVKRQRLKLKSWEERVYGWESGRIMEEARGSMKRWGSKVLENIGSGWVVAKDVTGLCKSRFINVIMKYSDNFTRKHCSVTDINNSGHCKSTIIDNIKSPNKAHAADVISCNRTW